MTTSIKTCKRCEAEKPLSEFYKHSDMKDGHIDICNTCTNKYKAHCKVNDALRDGKIQRDPMCSTCRARVPEVAHHDDYLRPLDIRWLCQECHCRWHAVNGEGANPF